MVVAKKNTGYKNGTKSKKSKSKSKSKNSKASKKKSSKKTLTAAEKEAKATKRAKKFYQSPSNKKNAFKKYSSSAHRCILFCPYKASGDKELVAQFNPEKLPIEFGASFAEMQSPGMSYPLFQYTGGKAIKFELDLYFHDIPYTGSIVGARKWLRGLLPPVTNSKGTFTPPPVAIYCGWWQCRFVVEGLKVEDELQDTYGRSLISKMTLKCILTAKNTHVFQKVTPAVAEAPITIHPAPDTSKIFDNAIEGINRTP